MFLDAIPILGHVKGGFHYLAGDIKGGNLAIYEATRSTVVMAGGALGAVGGPVGIASGAVAAGMALDLLFSLVSDSPGGVLGSVIAITTDIVNGEIPIEPALELSLTVLGDVVAGIGGATIANAAKDVGIAIGKDVGKEVIQIVTKTTATHSLARTCTPKSGNTRTTSKTNEKKGKSKQEAVTSGSGSDPPEEKQNKLNKGHYQETDTHWEAFFKVFGVMCLDDICMGGYGTHVFKNLDDGQRRSLYKLISQLRRHGGTYFVNVIKIVEQIFNKLAKNEVTFQNFISLVQFVMTYVDEEVAKRNDKVRSETKDALKPFKERHRELMAIVTTEVVNNVKDICIRFWEIQFNVLVHLRRISPCFRNDVSAVHHYFKHRFIPERIGELSVKEYFDLIHSSLTELKTLPHYSELSVSRRELVYERYMRTFERRIRTVLKVQGGNLELSSCYFLTVHIVGDKDGDEYVDGKKIRRWIIFLTLHRRKLYCLLALLFCLLCIFFVYF